MNQYVFNIKDNSAKAIKMFQLFLLFFHIAFISSILYLKSEKITILKGSFLLIFWCSILLFNWLKKNTFKNINVLYVLLQMSYMIFWYVMGNFIIAVLSILIIQSINSIQQRKNKIIFTIDGVSIQSIFSKKIYNWAQISNTILKDGLLTIDFANNKLLQVEVEENSKTDESLFNQTYHKKE